MLHVDLDLQKKDGAFVDFLHAVTTNIDTAVGIRDRVAFLAAQESWDINKSKEVYITLLKEKGLANWRALVPTMRNAIHRRCGKYSPCMGEEFCLNCNSGQGGAPIYRDECLHCRFLDSDLDIQVPAYRGNKHTELIHIR